MAKPNKQKKQELSHLLIEILDELKGMPKGVSMLAKAAVKALDEDKVDEVIDGAMDMFAKAFTELEKIKADENVLHLVEKTGTDDA